MVTEDGDCGEILDASLSWKHQDRTWILDWPLPLEEEERETLPRLVEWRRVWDWYVFWDFCFAFSLALLLSVTYS